MNYTWSDTRAKPPLDAHERAMMGDIDPLTPARGILLGFVIGFVPGLILWSALIWWLWP